MHYKKFGEIDVNSNAHFQKVAEWAVNYIPGHPCMRICCFSVFFQYIHTGYICIYIFMLLV